MKLSQSAFADAVRAAGTAVGEPNHCTKRLVQKWESGEHASCIPEYFKALQVVTGLPAHELGFNSTLNTAGNVPATDGRASGVTARDPSTALPAVADSLDTLIDSSMRQLRHALNHPATVDMRTADLVGTAIDRLFDLEHHSPARLMEPTLNRRLATVAGQLTAAQHAAVRHKLTTSIGRGALLAGWLAFDRGDEHAAHRLWDEAISAAEGTKDDGLFAACLIYQSYAAARRNDPETAWRLAHTASELTPDDPRATAWATTRVARHAAHVHDYDAAETAMQQALELGHGLASPTPGDGSMPWTRSFDPAMLLATTAHTAALLGDPRATDYATQAVDVLGTAKVKARAIVLAEAAFTAGYTGELKLCLEYGSAAAALTRTLAVSIAADLLHELVPLILPEAHSPAIRELLPQLAIVPRSADLAGQVEGGPRSTIK
ncbi:hypothetical protein KDK95_14745 [Actinospica sp. MGRD01-02]|uniref:Uncharacterized protein n=1 Tax=Actinospica acidithermotolerans TaxID=2828514 RepID=A0A941EEH1_9ACTN|nr:hypothetical protein [Actinospica acidithermotolerans]MBR7827574.1 hypothetical protein [Actinospica acidithermotolerans]